MERHPSDIEKDIEFLESLINLLKEELQNLNGSYKKCPSCHQYIPRKELLTRYETRQKAECIHHDAGYGDDDIIADVTRRYYYEICPKCKSQVFSSSIVLSETNKRRRN